ncbi:MAG TPA: PhoH family protein [Kosmotogaceae bacterium]|nr:MAG: PhoH family protein [Thermotogales bacterium 46_20]HAA85698.1 PhoH family protein [Kosmotogaceae bacterium]
MGYNHHEGGDQLPVRKMTIPDAVDIKSLFGEYDRKSKYLQDKFDVRLSIIDNEIWIKSDDIDTLETVKSILGEMVEMNIDGEVTEWPEFENLVEHYTSPSQLEIAPEGLYRAVKDANVLLKRIKPKTLGQKKYIEVLQNKDMVFSVGPAGTGKTYLAVAMAVEHLKAGRVKRIILTRPAVEAGERLGFLPGTLLEKIDPYLKPLYDALMDMMTPDRLAYYKERGIIEIVPLAYMRGRTLNNSCIILDEAQNTTYQQMKMFLTRVGFNSKVVVTGDITQIDLDRATESGLVVIQRIVKNIAGIGFVYLTEHDIVRNALVKEIIKAYDLYEREDEAKEKNPQRGI